MRVVDEQPRLEVLSVVGEVQPEHFDVTALRLEPRPGGQPHHVPTQGDGDVPQHRVLAQLRVVAADVDGVVGPVGDRHHGQSRGVADDEFDVVGVGSTAALIEDDHRLREFLDPDLKVAVRRRALAGTVERNLDRLLGRGTSCHGDDGRPVERREGLRGNPIGGYSGRTEPLVTAANGFHRHTRPVGDLDERASGRGRGAVVQPAQPLERGEPPQFVAAARHLEGVDVERCEQLALGPALQCCCQILSHYPTAPSI
jgi:hypothetical protein